MGFRPKWLRLLEKFLSIPISHQEQQQQMGLESDTKGMEEPGHQQRNQVSLMENEKSHLKNRKAFICLKDTTHKWCSKFMGARSFS